MNYLKRAGLGAVIWGAIFVVISILVALKITSPWISYPVGWIITIVLGWYFSKITKVKDFVDGIVTGIIFVAVAFILDYFITTKFTGMELFKSWDIWVGYVLLFLLPIIYSFVKKS